MKRKEEIVFTPAQEELIKRMRSPEARDSRNHLLLGKKDKKELIDFIHVLQEHNYRFEDITKVLNVSTSFLTKCKRKIRKTKESNSSTEVSNHKDSLHRVEVLTAKRSPIMSTFTVDLENKAIMFASTSDLFNFMKKSAGEE